jgi:hypothetical protein
VTHGFNKSSKRWKKFLELKLTIIPFTFTEQKTTKITTTTTTTQQQWL